MYQLLYNKINCSQNAWINGKNSFFVEFNWNWEVIMNRWWDFGSLKLRNLSLIFLREEEFTLNHIIKYVELDFSFSLALYCGIFVGYASKQQYNKPFYVFATFLSECHLWLEGGNHRIFHIISEMEMFHSANVLVDENRDTSVSVIVWACSGRYSSVQLVGNITFYDWQTW